MINDLSQWGLPAGTTALVGVIGRAAWKYATDRAANRAKREEEDRQASAARTIADRQDVKDAQSRADKVIASAIDRLERECKDKSEENDKLWDRIEALERESNEQRGQIAWHEPEIAHLKSSIAALQDEKKALLLELANRPPFKPKQE